MLNVTRALRRSSKAAPEMPRIEALDDVYRAGLTFRRGEVVMIAGRSGSQKSGFGIWLVSEWNLPTLYFAADMTLNEISSRLACARLGKTTAELAQDIEHGGEALAAIEAELDNMKVQVASGLITMPGIDAQIGAYVEMWNKYPEVIVIDNLMDVEGATSDYSEQMRVMEEIVALARVTGATVLVLHHATDKSDQARNYSTDPPTRSDIKNGMTEKPQLILGVSLDPHAAPKPHMKVAILKQRMGPSDQTGKVGGRLFAIPDQTRFEKYTTPTQVLYGER